MTVALSGYFFDKTVVNLTTGANPAVTAAPGDRLRYTSSFGATNPGSTISEFLTNRMRSTHKRRSWPARSRSSHTRQAPTSVERTVRGAPRARGVIDIRGLNLPLNATVQIQYDITLKPALANGTIVTNQSTARNSADAIVAVSDNPTDFIKTSTGKITPAATLPTALCMSEAIRDFRRETGAVVGLKLAGGIRTAKDAWQYLVVVLETLGSDWMHPDRLRLGASSLLNDLLLQRAKLRSGRYEKPSRFTID